MGTHLLQLLASITPPSSNPRLVSNSTSTTSSQCCSTTSSRCCSTRYGGRSGGSFWEERAGRTEGFRFDLDDNDFLANGGGEFDYGSAGKKRTWWSDEQLDDDGDEDEDGFGLFEGSIGIDWVFQVFRAFGWMLPAIAASMLIGTGTDPNAFFIALALPLAQSALSLVIDTLSGRLTSNTTSKARAKKRPFARAASNFQTSKEKEIHTQTDVTRRNHQTWAAADDISSKRGARTTMPNFGGWDELDVLGRTDEGHKTSARKVNMSRPHKKSKLSRKVRSRKTPLLMELLIAIFPFLGSWTKVL